MNTSRAISVSDTTLLITNAGGRCSYNHDNFHCNKILSDGRVNLGERAHIVGFKGPRSDDKFIGDINGYDNLIWLCRDHHKTIDHPENLEKYSISALHDMKFRHEQRIRTGRYPYYGTSQSLHDYSVLSCLFTFININTIYSCAASYPEIHLDFFDISDMCGIFKSDNPGDLPLKDPILREAFVNFEDSHHALAVLLRNSRVAEEDINTFIYTWVEKIEGHQLFLDYLLSVENLIELVERRFLQILHQELYNPFPDD